MTTSFQTLCLVHSPPFTPIPLPTSTPPNPKKPSSHPKSQKTWLINTKSNKSKIICMSHHPIYQQFLDQNFKKDDDIVRLAPLILKDPILVNFDNILNYQVFNSNPIKSTYEISLKYQVEQLFSGKSSNVMLIGPTNAKTIQQLASILSKNILNILKIQQNNNHILGISVQSIISNSISIDLLEQQTITSFDKINNKSLSILHLKYNEQIKSVLYLSNKNKQKINKLLKLKNKKQISMVYKLMLKNKNCQSVFSEIILYSPSNVKNINKREIESILEYIDNVAQNKKEYLLYEDSCVVKNLINEMTIAPGSISLIYCLVNDKKHLEENLITLNLAEGINQMIGKKEYIEDYSFIGGETKRRRSREEEKQKNKTHSRNRKGSESIDITQREQKSPSYISITNRKLVSHTNSNSQSRKILVTDRNLSSQNKTRKDLMNQQLHNKIIHLQTKLKQMATEHKHELERTKINARNKEQEYKQELLQKQTEIKLLLEKLNHPNKPFSSYGNFNFKPQKHQINQQNQEQMKEQIMMLRQNNEMLVERCKQLEVMLQGKNRIEEKLENVKKERNELKEIMKKMNQEIYQLIRDQEIDINKLKKQ